MVQQLPKNIGDTEANITNSIDIKCSALEDNVKQYINSVVFAYIDNLIHHVVIPTRESTSTMKSPNATSQEIGTSEVQQDTSRSVSNIDQVSQTDANANKIELENPAAGNSGGLEPAPTTDVYPTGLEPATPVPKLPIHDVYIGGARPTTTEEDLRAFLVKIGVTANSIQSISCISGDDPHSSSFRVILRIDSIKNTIYNSTNFKAGITVKPFRFYVKKGNKNIASSERNTMIQRTDNYTERRNYRNNNNRDRSATRDASRSQANYRNDYHRDRSASRHDSHSNFQQRRNYNKSRSHEYRSDRYRRRDSSAAREQQRDLYNVPTSSCSNTTGYPSRTNDEAGNRNTMYSHNHNDYSSYHHSHSSKPNLNVHAAPYIPYPYQMYANPYLTCVPPPNNTQVSSSAITPSTTQQGTANVNQVQFTNPGALQQ